MRQAVLFVLYVALHLVYIYSHTHFLLIMTPEAEKFNGWAAMLGFVAAFGAYATTGQILSLIHI